MKFKIYPRALFGYFGIIILFTFVHFYVERSAPLGFRGASGGGELLLP